MEYSTHVQEYKCPCCGAGLKFDEGTTNMTCEYCDNSFELETVKAFNEAYEQKDTTDFQWETQSSQQYTEEEAATMRSFICQSCGGVLVTEENTAATFCPYCENPAILPERLSDTVRPDAIIPFQKTKEDAKDAFLSLCKGKRLLPKGFTDEQRVEKITGLYIPFWLYDCSGTFDGQYKATRVHHWSDSTYNYTRTEHYLLTRSVSANFEAIPMDGATKIDNTIMESIEPFDYSQMVDFNTAYLSGFLADKYDVEANQGHSRVEQRVNETLNDSLSGTFVGFASVIPTSKQLQVSHGKAKYVLLPVWMLHSNYKGKSYLFAMNGQTGKMTGTFPICPKRSAAWFAGICAGVTALVSLVTMLMG